MANLDAAYFNNVAHLTDANALQYLVNYNAGTLTITVSDNYVGSFFVEATVFDGNVMGKSVFRVIRGGTS